MVNKTMANGHVPIARAAALDIIKRGVMPLPVPFGRKDPSNRRGWQSERYTIDDLSAFDSDRLNVGMMLGHVVAGDGTVLTDRFCDVDLDTPEAVLVAQFFLPETGMKWGREGNPRSHWGYRLTTAEGAKPYGNFNDPLVPKTASGKADARICEIRFTGQQTIAPGSTWTSEEDGHTELVRWEPDGDGDPAIVDFGYLQQCVSWVYATALVARYWKEGIRHSASLPLAGMLCLYGLDLDRIEKFIEAVGVAAHENRDAIDNRIQCARDTFQKMLAGQPYTGGPTLEDYIPKAIVAKVRTALKLRMRGTANSDIGPDGIPLSDLGNADRFVLKYEGKVVHCEAERCWYVYSEGSWMVDKTNVVGLLARSLVVEWRAYINSNPNNVGTASLETCRKHVVYWERDKNIQAMLNQVKPLLPITPEQFDSDPRLLNCLNGAVILGRDGTHYRREPQWQDFCTRQWNANYVPGAVHEDLEWYRRTFVPEDDTWEYIEEALGYSLLGYGKRYAFQLIGPSHSGKSMLLKMIKRNAGTYGKSLKHESLLTDRHKGGDAPRSDLVDLRGARLLTIPEVDHGAVWDVALFKTMTSLTDEFYARAVHARWGHTFTFTCAMWTSGNQPYGADANDDASYERMRVIRLDHPMPADKRDDQREDEITDPARTGDAFLAMALRGYERLYGEKSGRLTPPESVKRATAEVRDKLDRWTDIIQKLFVVDPTEDTGVVVSEAWAEALELFRDSGERVRSPMALKRDFELALSRRGAEQSHAGTRFRNRVYWKGVRWANISVMGGAVTAPDWEVKGTE